MVRVVASVDINRPIEDVFAYLADPTKASEWMSGILENSVEGGGPIHAGSRIKGVLKFLRKFDYTAEITQYDPPHTLAIRGLFGPGSKGQEVKHLESIGQRTRLRSRMELDTGGLFALADPILAALLKRGIETDLQTLKALVEAKVAAEA